MNAHNEQHDPASPVVKQNLTTQPAAVQEAAAYWRVTFRMYPTNVNYCEAFVRGPARPTLETLGITPRPAEIISAEPLYAAPVTASPADHLHAHLLHMLGAKDHEDAGRIIGQLHAATMRTPGAPGIDIEHFHRAVQRICIKFDGDLPYISGIAEVLDLIDASPKGDADELLHAHYCNAQPASAECICGLNSPKGGSEARAPLGLKLPNVPFAVFDEFGVGADDRIADYGLACAKAAVQAASTDGGSDPWRGLYAPERAPNRDEYGCFYHPDIPSWDDEREESIAPLLKAQGFDLQCVPGDFSDEAMEEGGERYWQEMREWNPEPEGDGWRLVAIYDTEDGPYSMFVKPLAQAGDAEVQP